MADSSVINSFPSRSASIHSRRHCTKEVSSYRSVICSPLCVYCKGNCLLECDNVDFCSHKLVFRRDVLVLFAGKNADVFSKKSVVIDQTLHDITSKMTVITFVIIIIITSVIYEFVLLMKVIGEPGYSSR